MLIALLGLFLFNGSLQSPPQQAVVETTHGTFVFELLSDKAPKHVAHFIEKARAGAFTGTTFHRVVKLGLIQGGDPLTRDPKMSHRYGTGGLRELAAEFNDVPFETGIVGAVLVPGEPDSAGQQFFVTASDQLALNGQFTAFGRIVEGLDVVRSISSLPASPRGLPNERVVINSVTIRDAPPPAPEPFADVPDAGLGSYVARIETTKGTMTVEFFAGKAPGTVRNFLRLASAGVYDGVAFHRVIKGFVIQTGVLGYREEGLDEAQQKVVPMSLAPEFNDTPHVKGVLSMARGSDPASATTSFFICTAVCQSLDGKYAAFGRVVDGLEVVEAIENVAVNGEEPVEKVLITRVKLVKRD